MKQFVAIIRGINVGGKNRVNMQVLRTALEKDKLRDVKTYIQSGNIVFRSAARKTQPLQKLIHKVLNKQFELNVPVVVREADEWTRTVSRNPFLHRTDDHTKLLVSFLEDRPAAQAVRALGHQSFEHDEVLVDGKDAYLFCRDGYGQTDISNNFLEKQLKVTATTRNWKTVLQVAEMLD